MNGTCAHCHLVSVVRRYRLAYVGERVLCAPCFASLDAMGMEIRAA